MSDHREDPIDEVVNEFRRVPVPDRPADERVLTLLADAWSRSAPDPTPPCHPIRRILMRPAFRYVSAAALLVVFGWLALGPPRSLALADVIKAAEQHSLVRFQATQTTDDRETRLTASGVRTVYVDIRVPRVREEEGHKTFNGILDFRYTAVYDYRRDRFLALVTHAQVMTRDQAKDEHQRRLIDMVEQRGLAKKEAILSRIAWTKTDDIPPMSLLGKDRGFLDTLRQLQADQTTLTTRATLDGRDVVKYRRRADHTTTSVWVNPTTKLPIRVEIEVIDPTPRIARNEWVYTDFEWDPDVADPERLFSTDPPAGFRVEDHTNEAQ